MTPDAPYTLRHIQQMLGLPRRAVAALIDSGFVQPTRGPRNAYRFTFQDVVLLRTAQALRAASVPPRKVQRALERLRARLPQAMPLSGLRLRAVGAEVAVREGGGAWAEAESGQLLFDFEVAAQHGSLAFLESRGVSAQDEFARGEQLEAGDAAAAEQAYRRALALDAAWSPAAINLTALLCAAGRSADAVAVCRQALVATPDEPLLHYNLGIALEDLGREADAVQAYARCLALDASQADAHFNLARLHERLGHPREALRHYSAYRRLDGG